MWEEKDFLKMMQVNDDLYGEEIRHITGADDAWLVNYFENRLVKLFYPYYFSRCDFCEIITDGKSIVEERLKKGGFGLTKKQCVEIGNFIACRYYLERFTRKAQFSELTTVVVLNYIINGFPLDETQYQIVHKPRFQTPEEQFSVDLVDMVEGLRDAFTQALEPLLDTGENNK